MWRYIFLMSELVNVWSADILLVCVDSVAVWQRFLDIVNRLTGVTVINSIKHDFPGGGLSGLVLIAESHAAIHTWPERNMAWVELATCGDPKGIDEFKHEIKLWVANNDWQ